MQSRFREGDVPAQSGVLEIVRQSVARLRGLGVTGLAVRSDSAGYQHGVLDCLAEDHPGTALLVDARGRLFAPAG